MDIQLAIRFLKGEFDPEYSRAKTMQLLEQAKRNNPKTHVVKAASDWGYDDTKAGRRKLKPHLLDRLKKVATGIIYTPSGKYQSQVKAFNKYYYLGVFDTEEEALQARNDAKAKLKVGEFVYRGEAVVDVKERDRCGIPKYIYFNVKLDKYYVQKKVNGVVRNFGRYATLEEAIARLNEVDNASKNT